MAAGFVDNVKSLWNRIFALQQQIESLKKENAALESEWNARKDQVKMVPPKGDQEYKNLILKKTKDAIVLLNQQKEAELERIRAEFEARMAAREAKARKADEELQMYRQLLQMLLDEMERVAHQIDGGSEQGQTGASWPVPREKQPEPAVSASVPVSVSPPIPVPATEPSPAERPPAAPAEASGDFWEDIDGYLEEEAITGPIGRDSISMRGNRLDAAAMTPMMQAAAAQEGSSVRGSKVVPFNPPASQERRKDEQRSGAGAAMNEEIEMIKSQYIVGNRAGEDIYDHKGHPIIKKYAEITSDIVLRAEAEGKLADLIVHMILPGFEETEHE